jgi:predicted GNAT superfamily acetyltransferase
VVNKDSAELENVGQKGFLINGFTAEELQSFLNDKENYIVLAAYDDHSHIVGYTIGYHCQKLAVELHHQFNAIFPDILQKNKVLYLRHIAKLPDTQKIGEPLLLALLERATQIGYQYVACQIAEDPHQNIVSKRFHEKFEFKRMGSGQFKAHTYGIYLRKL